MTFQIKAFASIAASIINHARATQKRVTDFTVGSVARTMLESPAVEIEQLYIQFFNGLLEAIPSAVYLSFGFDRLAAESGTGLINGVFTAQTTAYVIPAGTVWQVVGASGKFTNPLDIAMPPGTTNAQVRVSAQDTGIGSNVPGGTVFSMIPQVGSFLSATAAADFIGGRDVETDDERKQRFAAFVAALPRGTVGAVEYVLTNLCRLYDASGLEIERVKLSYIDEQWERDHSLSRALVDIYIFNGVDGASPALIARTLQLMTGYVDADGAKVAGYKAAGVHFNVYAAALVNQAIAATVVVNPDFDYATTLAAAKVAVANYLLALPIGATGFPEQISDAAQSVPGMQSFKVTSPAAPVTPALGAKLLVGAFTITRDTTSYAY